MYSLFGMPRFSNAEQRELQRLEERNVLPTYDC